MTGKVEVSNSESKPSRLGAIACRTLNSGQKHCLAHVKYPPRQDDEEIASESSFFDWRPAI